MQTTADAVNVLMVVLDCARADHISCYGYSRETTPFLDQIAQEGVRFPNVITTAPWTLPTHASLLTGMFAVTHGATDENRFLSARHKRLPEYLKAAGYRTAAFCTHPWVSPETGFRSGFDAFYTQRYHNRVAARAVSYSRRASDRLLRRTDGGARRTTHALKRWIAASPQPFFAFVHYNEAHLPYAPPPPFERIFLPRGITPARVHSVNRDCNAYIAGQVEMNDEDFVILTALYDGALRYVDSRLREIADFLRARELWDRTLFVVVGDHGENLGEHHMMGHKFVLYDTLLRVPLLLRCPPCVPQGFVIDELAQTTDVVPTALHLLGIPEDDSGNIQGRALLEEGRATRGPGFTVSECFRANLSAFRRRFPDFRAQAFDVRKRAIRTRREKFIWHSDEANEFYDLAADPGEENNLIDAAVARADALRDQLFDWLAQVEKSEPEQQAPALDDVMREQLQCLGYLE